VDTQHILILAALFFTMSVLYSSVGHGGASGYLAMMGLLGVSTLIMKPTALVMNLFVAGIATIQFARAGHFRWNRFWPFAVVSIPFAYVGGAITVPATLYKQVVGAVLVFAAYRLYAHARTPGAEPSARALPIAVALGSGSVIGLLSGLVGVGGGIFLSPLVLLARWADARTTAGISAAFILVNSAAGLLGHLNSVRQVPGAIAVWVPVVVAGGLLGSTIGSRRLPNPTLRRLLALVILVAAVKMLLVM